ncbi:MAG TPA: heterodisulfide reductase-related iron-sulfur binding cluster [Dehalococcoidia bacterium]|nr:heterodisulfide reductase-related iron-sulfur binding cluster [Dehalococcoidia bacterium]
MSSEWLPKSEVSLDIKAPLFWERADLDYETRRQFDVCHSCRLCFNLCEYFPKMFEYIDATEGQDVKKLTEDQMNDVNGYCFQCKQCFLKCPYTPPHEYAIDIPRLAMRVTAVNRQQGVAKIQDKIIRDTDLLGQVGSNMPGLTNWMNQNPVFRTSVLDRGFGIHPDRILPLYHRETFSQWAKRYTASGQYKGSGANGKVVIFYTCYINYNAPGIGKSLVDVLAVNDVDVVVPDQVCCGMPFMEGGMMDEMIRKIEQNVRVLEPFVRDGYKVIAPGASCALMLRREYPDLAGSDATRLIAENTFEPSEFLVNLWRGNREAVERQRSVFRWRPGKVVCHVPCHTRAQQVGFRTRDLFRGLLGPGAQVQLVDKCSAHDGTWGQKTDYYELSFKYGEPLFNEIEKAEADVVVTDCWLAGRQIWEATGVRPLYPTQLLAKMYGFDSGNGDVLGEN